MNKVQKNAVRAVINESRNALAIMTICRRVLVGSSPIDEENRRSILKSIDDVYQPLSEALRPWSGRKM